MIKILSLPVGMDACSYYRIKKVFLGIEQVSPGSTHIIDVLKDDKDALPYIFKEADVIFVRPGAEVGMNHLKKIMPDIKAKWVMDIDDNVEEISPLSQFYKEYGQSEAFYEDKPIWKDGIGGFSLESNQNRLKTLLETFKSVDLMTVTTPKLLEYAEKYNPSVYVNRNTIDDYVWWRINKKANRPTRVLWHGSPSHYEDWEELRDVLPILFDEYKFDLYMLGSAYMGIIPKKYHKRVKVYPWVPFEAHSYRCMSLVPDFAVIPLKNDKFNQYKSAIKWLEMSAMGVPSLVANRTPYKEVISNSTSISFNNPDEFLTGFREMMENPGKRLNLGNAAMQEVKKNHLLADESKKLLNRLEELCQ